MKSYCTGQGTISSLLGEKMIEESMRKRIYIICMTGSLYCTAEIDTTLNQLYFNKSKIK